MRAIATTLLVAGACGRFGFEARPASDAPASDAPASGCAVSGYTAVHVPGAGAPRAATVADFDGDGHLDLAFVDGDNAGTINAVSVALGAGDGTFRTRTQYQAGVHPWSITAGDLDGDGRPELVVGFFGDNVVGVYHNAGDGTFAAAATYAAGTGPQSVALGDLDGDGKLDLVTSANGGDQLVVMRGNGDGTFAAPTTYATGSKPYQVVTADLNGDGRLDLAVCNSNAASITVWLGAGGGTFAARADYATGSPSEPWSLATGDLDGDGVPDLAVANNFSSGSIAVLHGRGDGAFDPATFIAVGQALEQLWWIDIADATGDGKPDLVVADATVNVAGVLAGNGDGTFQTPRDSAVGTSPLGLAVGDFDGNGGLDIAAATQVSNEVTVLLSRCN